MKRLDLLVLEEPLAKEVERRRGLGGYSQDAEGILLLGETLLKLLQYVQYVADQKLEPKTPPALRAKKPT